MSMRTVLMTLIIGVMITLGIIVLVRFVPIPGLSNFIHKAERTLLPESVARTIDPASIDDQPMETVEKKNSDGLVTTITQSSDIDDLLNSNKPSVVIFHADFCSACQMAKAVYPAVAEMFKGRINFYALNTSERELVQEMEEKGITKEPISAIPTFVFFYKGKNHEQTKGFGGKDHFYAEVIKYLGV